MPKDEFDGISIKGETVQEFLATERQKELSKLLEVKDKYFYRGAGKGKYPYRKERNGKVKIMEQSKINEKNYAGYLIKANGKIRPSAIAFFLSGQKGTLNQVAEVLQLSPPAVKACVARLYNMTALHENLRRERTVIKGKFQYIYFFDLDGRMMTYPEALAKSMVLLNNPKEVNREKKKPETERIEPETEEVEVKRTKFFEEAIDAMSSSSKNINLENPDAPLKSIEIDITKVGKAQSIKIKLNF